MKLQPLPKSYPFPWFLIVVCLGALVLSLPSAYAATPPAKKKVVKKIVRRSPPPPVFALPGREGRETNLTVPKISQASPAPYRVAVADNPPALAVPVKPAVQTDDVVSRIVNFRLHPIYLAYMITDPDTVFAMRGDIDFIVSDKFTLGPSVTYTRTSTLDGVALASSGVTQYVNANIWEFGALSNIYLTGTTSTGGFLIRPHVYWVYPSGQKVDGSGNVTTAAASTSSGLRGGAEFAYQKMLSCGLNFEIGGGLTYYFIPYSVNYSDGGLASTSPSSRLMPTVTAGVGWAF